MKIIDKFSIKTITLLTVDEDLPKNGIIFIKNKLNNGLIKKELNITMDKSKKTWKIDSYVWLHCPVWL